MKFYRGIEITRPLNLSSDLLRKYETWGLVPQTKRGKNNYRIYTEVHRRFFHTTRRMMRGFSWTEVAKMMKLLVNKERESATILAIEYQSKLVENYKENKRVIEQLQSTINNIDLTHNSFLKRINKPITYKEVSNLINLPVSTLRVWEQEALFEAERGENNYRYFNQAILNRLFIIKLLRLSGLDFDQCRKVLEDIEKEKFKEIITLLTNRTKEMELQINNGLKSLGELNNLIIYLEEINYF